MYFNLQDLNGEANEAAQLIERYKVFDLWPCGKEERLIYGLAEHESKTSSKISKEGGASHLSLGAIEKVKKPVALAAPDISQMTPYKPSLNWYPGQHRIPGGVFPLPPIAAELCSKLPPPRCFEGPYVILDNLLRTLSNVNLEPISDNGNATEIKKEPNNAGPNATNNKRKLSKDNFSDNEEDNEVPTNDLYRKRQQRRIK